MAGLIVTNQRHPIVPTKDIAMHNRRVLVVGLGRFGGGLGVTRWLAEQDAHVVVTDLASADSLRASLEALADLDITFHLGSHDDVNLDDIDLAIINPAVVKHKSRFFKEIESRAIPWTTEMNLFCQQCRSFVVGVTGSYGKSTTTAMIGYILEQSTRESDARFRRVWIGGNIGRSLLNQLTEILPNDVVVLELSNAQLEDLPKIDWMPSVAVLTNLHPHHLDRYSSDRSRAYQAYQAAKLNILADAPANQPLFVGELEEDTLALIQHKLRGDPTRIHEAVALGEPTTLRVKGQHNLKNAALATTVCRYLGVDEAVINSALADFVGLAHRLEFVRDVGGACYINDSKSTSPDTTVRAIVAINTPIVLLVGGQAKDVSLVTLAQVAVDRCCVIVCFGEVGATLAKTCLSAASVVTKAGYVLPSIREVDTLEEAVTLASQLAKDGDTVLFSPGTPSFDQYANYEQRGEHFIRLVKSLRLTIGLSAAGQ